jgi:hypothetical protein
MKRYLVYLWYVLRHKYYVANALAEKGMYWRAITHDMSKFLPSEFIPYARYFYNPDGSKRQIRDKTGYYKPTDTGDSKFDWAWLMHQKRNSHHWQYFICPQDDGGFKTHPMRKADMMEMLCDWKGAGEAQGVKLPEGGHDVYGDGYEMVRGWYDKNRDKMILHLDTKTFIEGHLGYDEYWMGG